MEILLVIGVSFLCIGMAVGLAELALRGILQLAFARR